MDNYRFTLQKYKGRSTRHTCPQCGRAQCFTRYIDTATGEYLADDVGKCNHEHSCGYHKTPKQYFAEHDGQEPPPIDPERLRAIAEQRRREEEQERLRWSDPDTTDMNFIKSLQSRAEHTVLFGWLVAKVDLPRIQNACSAYLVGGTKDGRIVFPQIDTAGRCRTAKIMQYGTDGHRIQEGFNKVRWVPEMLFALARENHDQSMLRYLRMKAPAKYNDAQCWFGSHLITPDTTAVHIVESEKTAIVCRAIRPRLVWLATGGANYLWQKYAPDLSGIRVYVWPDKGKEQMWIGQMPKINCKSFKIVKWYDLEGVQDKMDVLDYFADIVSTTAAPTVIAPSTMPGTTETATTTTAAPAEQSATPTTTETTTETTATTTERLKRIKDELFGTPTLRKLFDALDFEIVDDTPDGYAFPFTMSGAEYDRRRAVGMAF